MSPIEHVEITPFRVEHLAAAAALLAARHRDDRTREPELPARFESPGATRAILERMFQRHLPETGPDDRTFYTQMLADPACACWIASRDGQPLAMQSFQPPSSYLSPMIVPDRSVYLLHGYTEPAARGRRVGTSLLVSALAWAREAGHRHCLLDFRAANLVSARFWLGHGFRPIAYRLCHRLDERLMWARPRNHAA